MKYIGGYSILDLTDANVSAQANACYNQDKPVLVYGANGERYFADTITKDGTNIIITKGGKTITIANDNTITNVGDILTIMENIVDSKGNNRFIDGDLAVRTIEGVNFNYAKWSLSGSHLMIVLAGQIADTTVLANGLTLTDVFVPGYIFDKIYPVWADRYLSLQQNSFIADDWSSQSVSIVLSKDTNKLTIGVSGNFTMTADRNFRIQFDLLIDADYSE